MSTGTYKVCDFATTHLARSANGKQPQIHVHNLSQLSLSFARHTNTENQTFRLLSSDYTKSVHLQRDRVIEFHTAGNLHWSTRIPRYGRDLIYDRRSAECLIPAVGVNNAGLGECYRLNLEVGRFMRSYEVDVGGDDLAAAGSGPLQGSVNAGAVNTGAIAEDSHNLLAFGTSLGTVEFWDARSRNRVGILSPPQDAIEGRAEVSAMTFHRSGLEMAVGSSAGLVHLYDLRSPRPLLRKDQGYGFAIKNIIYLSSSTSSKAQVADPKILTADQRIIKIWDPRDGAAWTSVEPAVDLNHVEWVKDTGMLLTANEGKYQHSFFIPDLGPAPKWCTFLDNITEEMEENSRNAFGNGSAGEVYTDYKFQTTEQLKQLNLDHLVGTTSLLRPYMHGYFVAQKLYEEARLISNPDLWKEQRAKSIADKINKERESRIRGNKKVAVKVNRKLAEKMLERHDKNERKRAKRVLEKGGDDDIVDSEKAPAVGELDESTKPTEGVLSDPRFARLFQDEDFEVDERSHEFQALNPSTKIPKGLTAAEQEELEPHKGSSDEDTSDSEPEQVRPAKKQLSTKQFAPDNNRISSSSYKKAGHKSQRGPDMVVSSSHMRRARPSRDSSFGSRVSKLKDKASSTSRSTTTVVGEREITFAPEKKQNKRAGELDGQRHDRRKEKDRRSASNNAFRGM
jgi:ribosome biogenesis protein ENP2